MGLLARMGNFVVEQIHKRKRHRSEDSTKVDGTVSN